VNGKKIWTIVGKMSLLGLQSAFSAAKSGDANWEGALFGLFFNRKGRKDIL
jgi:hypothetical protein